MSVTNTTWPKYTAVGPNGPCGHQHNGLLSATNCAENLSHRHRGQRVAVRRRDEDGTGAIVATVAVVK